MSAPIPIQETMIPLLRMARDKRQMFLYRLAPEQERPISVDAHGVSAILSVYDSGTPSIRKQIRALAPNVGRAAVACLDFIKKLEEK